MKDNRAMYVSKRNTREDRTNREYVIYPSKVVKNLYRRYDVLTNDKGVQFNYKLDSVLCTCKNISGFRRPQEVRYFSGQAKHIYAYHGSRSFTDIGVGSISAFYPRKVKRIYLPDTSDRGVGSSDLTNYYRRKTTNNNKKTSSKCVGAIFQNFDELLVDKLSPVAQTKSGGTDSISFQPNQQNPKTNVDKNKHEKKLTTKSTQMENVNVVGKVEVTKVNEIKVPQTLNKIYEVNVPNTTNRVNDVKLPNTTNKINEMKMPHITNKVNEVKVPHITKKVNEVKVPITANKPAPRTKPIAAQPKQMSRRAQEAERVFSSDSILQNVYDLESPSFDSTTPKEKEKLEVEFRNIFGNEQRKKERERRMNENKPNTNVKSASTIRRRFDALRKGVAKKEESKKNNAVHRDTSYISDISRRDVSIASDPPSLEGRSFSNSKISSPDTSIIHKPTYGPKLYNDRRGWSQLEDDEYHGVKGMFKMWGNRFNLEDETDNTQKLTEDSSHKSPKDTIVSPNEDDKKDGKKFFFFKKKSKDKTKEEPYKPKKGVTTGRCEVGDGFRIKVGGTSRDQEVKEKQVTADTTTPDEYEEMIRKAWLKKFLMQTRESRKSLNIRWNNNAYATSSSTLFEVMESVYRDTDVSFRSRSDTSMTESFYSRTTNRYNTQKVNFVQDIEAWMIPKCIIDAKPPLQTERDEPKNKSQLKTSYHQWFIDKSKAFAHKIEVVLHSRNVVKPCINQSSEYITIDIPKGFLANSSTDSGDTVLTSNEEVYKIVEYESPESSARLNKEKQMKNINITVHVKDVDESVPTKTEIGIGKVQRNVVIQASNAYMLKRCNVVGVGIITLNDIYRNKQLTTYRNECSEDSDSFYVMDRCTKSYLEEYYRLWLSDLGFCSMCASDTNIYNEDLQSCVPRHSDISKSCPNVYNDFQATAAKSSCETSCTSECSWDTPSSAQTIFSKILSKLKQKIRSALGSDIRLLPKDSLEVLRKRALYANGNRSKWSCPDGSEFTLPSNEQKGTQDNVKKPNTKKVCVKSNDSDNKVAEFCKSIDKEKTPKKVSILSCNDFLKEMNLSNSDGITYLKENTNCSCNERGTPCPIGTNLYSTGDCMKPSIESAPKSASPCSPKQESPKPSPAKKLSMTEVPKSLCSSPGKPCCDSAIMPEQPTCPSPQKKSPTRSPPRKRASPHKCPSSTSSSPAPSPTTKRCSPKRKLSPRKKGQSPSSSCPDLDKSSVCSLCKKPKTDSPCGSRKGSTENIEPVKETCCPPQTCSCAQPHNKECLKTMKKQGQKKKVRKSSKTSSPCPCTPPAELPCKTCKKGSNQDLSNPLKKQNSKHRKSLTPKNSLCECKESLRKIKSLKPRVSPKSSSDRFKSCKNNAPPACPLVKVPCAKKVSSQEFPWPLKNQISNQPSMESLCPEMKPPCPNIKPKVSQCPSQQSCKAPDGIKIQVIPKKSCSSDSIRSPNIKCPARKTCSDESIIVNIRRGNPSTDEIRDGLSIKVVDGDGKTIYERKDYKNKHSTQRPQVKMSKNSHVHTVSTTKSVKNVTIEDESSRSCLMKPKSDTSIANLIEISFKIKVPQSDKTGDIQFGNEGNTEIYKVETKNQIGQTSQEIYMLKDESEQCTEDYKVNNNDINVNIVIKSFKPKVKHRGYGEEFSQKIYEKYHNVSTDYNDSLTEQSGYKDLCTQKETMPPKLNEGSHSLKDIKNKYDRNELQDKIHNDTNDFYAVQQEIPIPKYNFNKEEENVSRKPSVVIENEEIPKCLSITDGDELEPNYNSHETGDELNEVSDKKVTTTSLTRDEKKSFLKKMFSKAAKVKKSKSNNKIKQFKEMIKFILTDSSDHEDIAVTSNELVKEMTYASLKPNYFRDTDSIDNYYNICTSNEMVPCKEGSSNIKPVNEHGAGHTTQCSDAETTDTSSADNGKPSCGTGCLCSQFATKLNMCSTGACLCAQQKKANQGTFCDLRTNEDFLLLNYKSIEYMDVETQNSKFLCNSTNISFQSRTITGAYQNSVETYDSKKQTAVKNKGLIEKETKVLSKGMTHECCGLKQDINSPTFKTPESNFCPTNKKTTTVTNCYNEIKTSSFWANVNNKSTFGKPADVLQSYATKKAVLQIYAHKTYSSEKGERVVAKLPKFVYERESAIERRYNEIIGKLCRGVKNEVFMMSGR